MMFRVAANNSRRGTDSFDGNVRFCVRTAWTRFRAAEPFMRCVEQVQDCTEQFQNWVDPVRGLTATLKSCVQSFPRYTHNVQNLIVRINFEAARHHFGVGSLSSPCGIKSKLQESCRNWVCGRKLVGSWSEAPEQGKRRTAPARRQDGRQARSAE